MYVLVRHKIASYDRWRPFFDGPGAVLHGAGSRDGKVFRNQQVGNELFVLLEWPDAEKARTFMESKALREAMAGAGVIDKPDIWYLEELETPQV